MPKSRQRTILVSSLLLLVWPCIAHAAGFARIGFISFRHEPYYLGARNTGLGSADLATASGPMAILHNPAARQQGQTLQVGFDKSEWADGYDVTDWALAGEWKRFRLGLVRHENASRDNVIRMAYNPEGTGETFDIVQTVWTIGLSTEVLPTAWRQGGFSANVGVNWRHYRDQSFSNETSGDDADIGLTVSWRHEMNTGWLSLSGATMKHNISQTTLITDIEDREPLETVLPYYSQTGVTLIRTWLLPDQAGEALRLLVAYSHRNETQDEDRDLYHADRWGVELTAVEIASFRWGDSDDSLYAGMTESMGLGLATPQHFLDPVSVQLEWARFDTGWIGGWRDVWGMTVAARF